MTEDSFILNELQECATYSLAKHDLELIEKSGLEEFVFAKLTSKKFRKWALSDQIEKHTRQAIRANIKLNRPLEVRLPFGGYKLWSLPTAPEVDWAEFFSMAYYCRYVAPIVAAYPPGVNFVFSSDEVIMERMNNLPSAHTESYFTSFERLIQLFSGHFPHNLAMSIRKIGDLYEDKYELGDELAILIKRTKSQLEQTDKSELDALRQTAAANIMVSGARDMSRLATREREDFIDESIVIHEAYRLLSRRHQFNYGEDKIAIFPQVNNKAIPLGSTKNSAVKFWIGTGVLESRNQTLKPMILSPKHLGGVPGQNSYEVPIDFIDIHNLKTVRVY